MHQSLARETIITSPTRQQEDPRTIPSGFGHETNVSWNLVSLRYSHRDIPLTRNARARARCVIKPRCNAAGRSGLRYGKLRNRPRGERFEEITCPRNTPPCMLGWLPPSPIRVRIASLTGPFSRLFLARSAANRKLRARRASLRFVIEKWKKEIG